MKFIVIVPDGMADEPMAELNHQTPLQAANTTNMDFMAKNGTQGLLCSIPKGMHPGSEIGNLSLLGYRPELNFTGRAPLEAASMGIDLKDDEVVFRCNLVTLDGTALKDYSAGHIPSFEAAQLIDALNETIPDKEVRFFAGKSYRHLMVMKVRNVKEFTSIKCWPPHDIMGKPFAKHLPQGKQAPMLLRLMEAAQRVLEEHSINRVRVDLGENPANSIWLWGQGTKPRLEPFQEKFNLRGAIISAVDLVNGIGKLAGLDVIHVPGATGYYDTDYRAKADYAIEALRDHDFVFIHVESPDEAGHNGDTAEKVRAIERIDQDIIGTILNHFSNHSDMRIIVMPDHPTPLRLRTHTANPVPFVIYGKGIASDGSIEYNEASAKESGTLFMSGEELMNHFTNKYL
ncbi:MAG TPA: cofactor-independent phosphoglycerate mutase [Candidatus Omnitrophota bacterium]|nr:cofactor-independent phosphoglycerate mutase [Candidatus Omnitrophota bacterium]